MPAPVLRRGLWALGVALLAIAVVALALPYAASTKIVRDRIAVEMSAWSGFQVSIGAPPRIDVWPGFGATLTDVTFSPWNDTASADPVITAERIEIDLSALAALRGNVVFSEARFIRPTLYLHRSAAGLYLPTFPGGGRLSRALDTARALVAENRETPDISRLPDEKFGQIEFEDGRIVASSAKDEDAIRDVSGKIDWPALNRPGGLTARGVWHGEPVSVDIGSASPLLLVAGANTPVSINVKSAPGDFTFGGSASLRENGYFEGKTSFSAPSLPVLLEWSALGMAIGPEIGSVAWEAHISGDRQRVKFGDASLAVNGSTGTGAVDLMMTAQRPVISGTLAFGSLDLRTLMSALLSLESGEPGEGNVVSGFAESVDLDLRLSANTASAGALALTNVAATAQVNDGFSAFDISEATAFGGTIQAGLRIDRAKPQAEIRLQALDVDGSALGSAIGMQRLVPSGKGTISVILKSSGRGAAFLQKATGSVSANFGPGDISGFDLEDFLSRTSRSGFFGLDEVSDGSLPASSINFEASLANGVATINKAKVVSAQDSILLSGIVSYSGRGLALSGVVVPTGQPPQEAPTASLRTFFVGGTWEAPYISPVLKAEPEEQ